MGKPLTDEQREELARAVPPGNPVRVLIGDIPSPWARDFLLQWLEHQMERGVVVTREAGGALTFTSTGGVEHTIPPGPAAVTEDGAQRPRRAERETTAEPPRRLPHHTRGSAAHGNAAAVRRQCGQYAVTEELDNVPTEALPLALAVLADRMPPNPDPPAREHPHTTWGRTAELYRD